MIFYHHFFFAGNHDNTRLGDGPATERHRVLFEKHSNSNKLRKLSTFVSTRRNEGIYYIRTCARARRTRLKAYSLVYKESVHVNSVTINIMFRVEFARIFVGGLDSVAFKKRTQRTSGRGTTNARGKNQNAFVFFILNITFWFCLFRLSFLRYCFWTDTSRRTLV